MIPAEETFNGTWPFAPQFFEGAGFKMHYVDEGPSGAEPIVCLHGEPTWGYLYRNFIPPLSEDNRVIVPDHMGFGKSQTPQDREYEIQDHAENFEKLMLHLDLRDITLVIQDWGGAIGGSFAYKHPERVKRLCIMDTIVPGSQIPDGTKTIFDHHWFKWINSDAYEPTLSNLGSTILSVMKRIGFENTAQVDETWLSAYASPFPTLEECKGAIKFPHCIASPVTMEYFFNHLVTPEALEALRSKPAMYIHGEEDGAIPTEFGVASFKGHWPEGPVIILPGVGHFCQEDAPLTIVALIKQFMQMT